MRFKTTKVIAALLSAAITVSSLVSVAPASDNDVIIAEASQNTTGTEDKFNDTIYSMPGTLDISFPPVDSGENHDPRVTDIVAALWNGLDDSNIATYTPYAGDVSIHFGPRFIDDDGKEQGTYDSLGDIVSISNSLDMAFEYMKNTKNYNVSKDVSISNKKFDYFAQVLANTSTIRELIYGFTKTDDNRVNLAVGLGGYASSSRYNYITFGGKNETSISIVKDDYYYLCVNEISHDSYDRYSTRMWYSNYFDNHSKDYGCHIHYIIDLRPKYDYNLASICSESGGKYIQYSPDNLRKLIRLINERRAFDDKVSPTPPPYDPSPNPSTTTDEDPVPGADKDPIVLIPGIMGSKLYDAKDDLIWPSLGKMLSGDLGNSLNIKKTLYVKNYDSNGKPIDQNSLDPDDRETGPSDSMKELVNKVCDKFPDREVYVFNYDWRKSNRESAIKLKEFIDKISADKVDIVAHSMGGLVTSLYIASQGKNKFDKVDKIITAGTPYEGAPHVFEAIEQEKILDTTYEVDGGKNMILSLNLSRKDLLGFPGVCELIPSLSYCSAVPMSLRDKSGDRSSEHTLDADGYRSLIADELGSDNAFSAFSLQDAIRDYTTESNILLNYENAYFLMGQNKPTVRDVTMCKNSKGAYDIVGIEYTWGDGTVPYLSAEMAGMIYTYRFNSQYTFDSGHAELIEDDEPLDCICKILNNEKPDAPHYMMPEPYTEFIIHCPVDVEIGTGDDRLCSAADSLSKTSSFGRLDIIGENNDEKVICMKSGTNLDLNITGTDVGTMDFSVRHYSGENELLDESTFDDVPITDSTIIKTNADSGEETVLSIDKDGDDVVDETWTANKGDTVSVPDETIHVVRPISDVSKNILYGDVNFDGVVNTIDAITILRYISDSKKYPLDAHALEVADVCDHGTSGINGDDARAIMMVSTMMLSQDKLPITKKELS